MAQQSLKRLTPQVEAFKSLKLFQEAMKTLESSCSLYHEFTDSSDPYDNHVQPRRGELERTYRIMKITLEALEELIEHGQIFRVSEDEESD